MTIKMSIILGFGIFPRRLQRVGFQGQSLIVGVEEVGRLRRLLIRIERDRRVEDVQDLMQLYNHDIENKGSHNNSGK